MLSNNNVPQNPAVRIDIDNMTLSSVDLERSRLEVGGEKTLTNLSQSTLNFILDEQHNVSASVKQPTAPLSDKPDLNANASGALISEQKQSVNPTPVANPTPIVPVKNETKPLIPINASDSIISLDSSNNTRSNDTTSNDSSTSAASLIDLDDTTISIVGSSEEGIYDLCFVLFLCFLLLFKKILLKQIIGCSCCS